MYHVKTEMTTSSFNNNTITIAAPKMWCVIRCHWSRRITPYSIWWMTWVSIFWRCSANIDNMLSGGLFVCPREPIEKFIYWSMPKHSGRNELVAVSLTETESFWLVHRSTWPIDSSIVDHFPVIYVSKINREIVCRLVGSVWYGIVCKFFFCDIGDQIDQFNSEIGIASTMLCWAFE